MGPDFTIAEKTRGSWKKVRGVLASVEKWRTHYLICKKTSRKIQFPKQMEAVNSTDISIGVLLAGLEGLLYTTECH